MGEPRGAAAADVQNDYCAVLELFSEALFGAFPCHGAAVQNVTAALFGDLRHAGDAGNIVELIHGNGIVNHCGDAEGPCDGVRKHAGKVRNMGIDLGGAEVIDHGVVDPERSRRNGRKQAAASHYAGEAFLLDAVLLQRLFDERHAVIELIHDPGEVLDFLKRVTDGNGHYALVIVEYGELGGGGAGVYNKNSFHFSPFSVRP